MLAFVKAGHNQHALTIAFGDLGGGKLVLAGLLQGEGALFAVKLLEQFGCFHRAFFFAQLLGVLVEFAKQAAVIN